MKKITYLFLFFITFSYAQFNNTEGYSITTKTSGRYLTAAYTNSNQPVPKADFYYSAQRNGWKLIDNGDGTYKILNIKVNKLLTVVNSDVQYKNENSPLTDSQKWEIVSVDNNYYRLKNTETGYYLTSIGERPNGNKEDDNTFNDVDYYDYYNHVASSSVTVLDGNSDYQMFMISPIRTKVEEGISVPQLGWTTAMEKKALLVSNTLLSSGPNWELKNGTITVASGTSTLFNTTTTWGKHYYIATINYNVPGDYTLNYGTHSTSVAINDEIYTQLKSNFDNDFYYSKAFNGFWNYNAYYSSSTLDITQLGTDSHPIGTSGGPQMTLSNKGWFDAHSRDSKVGRTAKALADFCYAYFNTQNTNYKSLLKSKIKFTAYHLLEIQDNDGAWGAGKIRESNHDDPLRKKYYWIDDVGAYTSARVVKALALTAQVCNQSGNPSQNFINNVVTAAEDGWDFIIANEDKRDNNSSNSWKGHYSDYFGAAVEMAYITNEQEYFNKADYFAENTSFSSNSGHFNYSGTNPNFSNAIVPNKFGLLDAGTIISIARYKNIAPSQASKDNIEALCNDFVTYWNSIDKDAFGLPYTVLDGIVKFGKIADVTRLATCMAGVSEYTDNADAKILSERAFNVITGFNPYGTSYVVGLGNSDITPSMRFMKRSYTEGYGAILPGFYKNVNGELEQSHVDYKSTEGVVPTSSSLFYLLSRLDKTYSWDFNSDFEDGVSVDWSLNIEPNKNIIADVDNADNSNVYEGSFSAKISVTDLGSAKSSYTNVYHNSIKLNINEDNDGKINLSFYAKNDLSTSKVKSAIRFYDSNDNQISSVFSIPLSCTDEYQQFNMEKDIPSNAQTFSIELRCGKYEDTYYFDDIQITYPEQTSSKSIVTKTKESTKIEKLLIYPNPASDIINIRSPHTISQVTLQALNYSGNLIDKVGLKNNSINVSSLSSGVYVLRLYIKETNNIITKKVIIR